MNSQQVNSFIHDLRTLSQLPTLKRHEKLLLAEYPFDGQLLNLSPLYRTSRKLYLELGGFFAAKICSTMRSLSAQDLFKNEISYTPSASELLWFVENSHEVSDPGQEFQSIMHFNEISLFHEQNHRVIWRLLPPAPKENRDLSRYLNFAESLVVIVDLALGDELGRKYSPIFERMKVIYRSGGDYSFSKKSKNFYHNYLLALFCTTYYALEMIHYDDIFDAVNFVLPKQKKVNAQAVKRGLEINELFTRVTNPLWQERYSSHARKNLKSIHSNSKEEALYLPEDPLDISEEFHLVRRVFDYYGI